MEFQTYSDGHIKSDIVLSIGILVSNNIKYIEKCMEGLKPILDNVKSELIIIDTVGPEKSDGSVDVCRRYTDKIYRFEWINDFAAARNECIKHARGEWFMFMDDDEWFDDVSEIISFFSSEERFQYDSGFLYSRNYHSGGNYTDSVAGRLVRRRPTTCFVGKVHETIKDMSFPGKQFSCFFHHMGYAFESDEQKRAKMERNLSALKDEMEAQGMKPWICAQTVQTLANLEERRGDAFALSIEYADRLVSEGFDSDNCVQWLITFQVRYFHIINDMKGVMVQADEVRSKYKMSPLAELAVCIMDAEAVASLMGVAGKREHAERVRADIDRYCAAYDYYEQYPDRKLSDMQLDLPVFLTPDKKNKMYIYGVTACYFLGEYNEAYAFWRCINWAKLDSPFERFADCISSISENACSVGKGAFEDPFLTKVLIDNEKEQGVVCYGVLYLMSEAEIKHAVKFGAAGDAISGLVNEYINAGAELCKKLVNPASTSWHPEGWLVTEYKYTGLLFRFINEGKKDLQMVLEAAKLRPDMAKSLSVWIGGMK